MAATDHSNDIRVSPAGPDFRAKLATADDGTELCTIYPKDVEADAKTTTWISAEEGSFVALEEMR